MANYFVTRHQGAREWALRQGFVAKLVTHLELGMIAPGDVVLGTLPVNLAAEVNARGARYLHLALDLPHAARGAELTADDMERYAARLVEYRAERVAGIGRD